MHKRVLLATPVSKDKWYALYRYVQCVLSLDPAPDEVLLVFDQDDLKGPSYYLSMFEKVGFKIPLRVERINPYEDHLDAIGHSRNLCLGVARKTGTDYIFFLDADIVCAPAALQHLIECNKGISSGVVASRELPPGKGVRPTRINAYMKQIQEDGKVVYSPKRRINRGELVDVDVVGNDCMLISREVFEEQDYEWSTTPPRVGEDFDYCLRAKSRGFTVTVDGGVWCDHFSPVEVFSTRTGEARRTFLWG